jgi:hypothetical protein
MEPSAPAHVITSRSDAATHSMVYGRRMKFSVTTLGGSRYGSALIRTRRPNRDPLMVGSSERPRSLPSWCRPGESRFGEWTAGPRRWRRPTPSARPHGAGQRKGFVREAHRRSRRVRSRHRARPARIRWSRWAQVPQMSEAGRSRQECPFPLRKTSGWQSRWTLARLADSPQGLAPKVRQRRGPRLRQRPWQRPERVPASPRDWSCWWSCRIRDGTNWTHPRRRSPMPSRYSSASRFRR